MESGSALDRDELKDLAGDSYGAAETEAERLMVVAISTKGGQA